MECFSCIDNDPSMLNNIIKYLSFCNFQFFVSVFHLLFLLFWYFLAIVWGKKWMDFVPWLKQINEMFNLLQMCLCLATAPNHKRFSTQQFDFRFYFFVFSLPYFFFLHHIFSFYSGVLYPLVYIFSLQFY